MEAMEVCWNRRKRKRLNFGFHFYESNEKIFGFIQNFIIKGCFIKPDERIKRDTLHISFELPDTLQTVNAECEVLRKDNTGIGASFAFSTKDKMIFSRFINDWQLVAD